jgi:hypothetical protein
VLGRHGCPQNHPIVAHANGLALREIPEGDNEIVGRIDSQDFGLHGFS